MFHTGVRDEHLQCSLTLQSLLSIEISLVCKTNLLLLVAGLFAFVWKEGIVSKYRSKICIKSNQEGEWNSLKIMNRSTPQQTQDYDISVFAQLKTWIISHVEECFYADKLCTDTLLLIGIYNKLWYNVLKESLSHVASLLETIKISTYIWSVYFKATGKLY